MKRKIKILISYLRNWIKFFRLQKKGKSVLIGKGLKINGYLKEKISIGNNVEIGDFARMGNTFSSKNGIQIGNNCFIGNYFTALDGDIIIEENCLLASHVSIFAANHHIKPTNDNQTFFNDLIFKRVIIKRRCWIGENVVILPGVEIGENSIIGAGSVVTKNIPSNAIAVGNPAKVIKMFNFEVGEWENVKE